MGEFTIDGILLPAGLHSARPSAGSVAWGTLYPESDTGLIYQSDGTSTWTLWATLGGTGLADEGTFTYLDATDGTAPGNPASGYHRLYSKSGGLYYRDNGGTEVGPLGAAGGGGRPYLDTTPAIDGTYGDDFTGPALDGKWTAAAGLTPHGFGYAVGDGSQLGLYLGQNAAEVIYETAPATDEWEAVLSCTNINLADGDVEFGIAALTSSGDGIGAGLKPAQYYSSFDVLSAYAYSSQVATLAYAGGTYSDIDRGHKMWISLRQKRATDGALGSSQAIYLLRFSLDGINWTRSLIYIPSSFTLSAVGFGHWGGSNANRQWQLFVDRFNVFNYVNCGNNLVRHPSSGSASYSASSTYGGYPASNAADGNLSTTWAQTGSDANPWWMVTWTVGQSLNRVRFIDRNGGRWGRGHVEFSDGSTTWYAPYEEVILDSSGWHIIDLPSPLTGITTMKLVSDTGNGMDPNGFAEVEAYLAS